MNEIWKDIIGFEGLYEVSSLGNIKSLINNKGIRREKILKVHIGNRGYGMILLCKDKIVHNKSVHQIVAKAFINNPDNKKQVNHINGIKHDNRVENLEWCNQSENSIHAFKMGLREGFKGDKNGCSKLKEKDILEIRSKYIHLVYGLKELSKEYKVSQSSISQIINRKIWKHI